MSAIVAKSAFVATPARVAPSLTRAPDASVLESSTWIVGVVVGAVPGAGNAPSTARSSASGKPVVAINIEPFGPTAVAVSTRGRARLSGGGKAGAVTVARTARAGAIPPLTDGGSSMPSGAPRDPGAATGSRDTRAGMGDVGNTQPPCGGPDAGPTVLRSHRSSNRSTPRTRATRRRGTHAPPRVIDDIAHHERDSIGTATTTRHPVKLTPYGRIPSSRPGTGSE